MVCDSGDEMEVDEEEARTKMKTILKTFLIELELIYDEKFSSESNDEILQQIIPQLIEAIKSRVRLLYKQRDTLDKDNHCLHRNNQLNEYSESDEEQSDGKRHINVYNLSWRSEEIYNIVSRHLRGAPNWTYIEQNMLADTNFSELETLIQTMKNLIMAEDMKVSAEIDEIEIIEDSELTGIEESKLTEESEPIGVEKSLETEDETDKCVWFNIKSSRDFIKKQLKHECDSFAATIQFAKLSAKQVVYLHNAILIPKLEYRMQLILPITNERIRSDTSEVTSLLTWVDIEDGIRLYYNRWDIAPDFSPIDAIEASVIPTTIESSAAAVFANSPLIPFTDSQYIFFTDGSLINLGTSDVSMGWS
ncbi:hypothetical protein RhiirB3_393622 [Rhizophagus irregularis]|nr:hypothetical protein RhiirB3_393622 [Rhizophagus irregularis]